MTRRAKASAQLITLSLQGRGLHIVIAYYQRGGLANDPIWPCISVVIATLVAVCQ